MICANIQQMTNYVALYVGVVTQTLLKALLERGGYRVTRLGIEELFAEVKHLDLQQYLGLHLPLQLRFIQRPWSCIRFTVFFQMERLLRTGIYE